MKRTARLLSLFLITAILITAMPLVSSAGSSALADKTIVTFGDSLTKLGNSSSTLHYSDYLATDEYLGVPIINMGVGGDSTKHGMARFEADVLSKNPDLVIICFGMNDQACLLSSGTPNVPIDTYRYNLTYFVEKLQAIGSDVVFFTPNPVLSETGYYTPGEYGLDYGYGFLDDFCNVIREVSLDYGCTLVDINYECEFEDLYEFISDGLHQTTYGKKQYAKYISDHLLAVYDGVDKAVMTIRCVDENGELIREYSQIGKSGAHITVATPDIYGYYTKEEDVKTTFKDGETFVFEYSFKLNELIDQAKNASFMGYSETIIEEIRECVSSGEALLASNASKESIFSCSDKLELLLSLSGNAQYVQSLYADCEESSKLTDGVKGTSDGSSDNYVSWTGKDSVAEIVIDLGEEIGVNCFSIYSASGQNDASKPAKLTVSVSDNGESFEEVGTQTAVKTTVNTDKWDTKIMTVVTDAPILARYVKYEVTSSNTLLLIDEVEASLAVTPVKNAIAVDAVNRLPEDRQITVFTKDAEIKDNDGNYYGVLVGFDGDEYKVVAANKQLEDIKVSSDEMLFTARGDKTLLAELKEGDSLTLSGVDLEEGTLGIMPFAKLGIEASDGVVEGSQLWVTHFNDATVEGAGVIFTNTYFGCAWWLNVAFAPVPGHEGVYEVVAKSDGASNGKGAPVDIPKGGFAYAVNTGNDYITLNKDPEALNFKNSNAANALAAARKWKIGDRFVFGNLDLENKEVPTTTAHIDYFAKEYVCTATIAPYVPKYKLGDVNGKDGVEKYDYILVKRAVMKTISLSESQNKAADVNCNGNVEKYDYILIKRHVMGTYSIEG